MKIKNVSVVDRYVHKLIPLVALLFIGGVLWFYVIGSPYRAELDSRTAVESPAELEKLVKTNADDLKTRMNRTDSPLRETKVYPYTQDFIRRAQRTMVGKPQFDVPLGQPGLDPKQFPTTPQKPRDFVVVLPPPATGLKAREVYGVLALPKEEKDKGQADAWVKLVGNTEPRDVRVVTVTGEFDFSEWRRRLMVMPGQNLASIPEQWWRAAAMTDVILERQTKDPITGEWGPVERIDALPNASPNYRGYALSPEGPSPAEVVNSINFEQEQIRNEPPPPLTPDHPWQPPGSEVPLTPEQLKRLSAIDTEIRTLQERIGRMSSQNTPAPAEKKEPPRPGAPTAPPAGGAPGRGPAGPAPLTRETVRPAAPAGGTRAAANTEKERAKLVEELKGKVSERQSILQPNKPALRADDGRIAPPTIPGGNNLLTPVGDQGGPSKLDKVDIWAHDVTAKPGMTYRYRIAISVVNPLFQKPLGPNQRKLADQLSLTTDFNQEPGGANAGWGAPITLDGDTYFFVTNANSTAKNVTVQVWRLYGGQWRAKEFNVQAGDPIGGKSQLQWSGGQKDVDLAVGATVVDIDFDSLVFNQPMTPRTTRLLYLDAASNTLKSRTVLVDKDDPRLQKFKSQAMVGPVAESGH